MSTKFALAASLILGSAMWMACEERPEARPAPSPDRTTVTPPSTGTVSQDMQTRANTLIQQVRQQISNGQYQAAEDTLRQLDSMKLNLPQSTQQEIENLRTTLKQHQAEPAPAPAPTP